MANGYYTSGSNVMLRSSDINTVSPSYFNGVTPYDLQLTTEAPKQERNSLNVYIITVRVKDGWLGQIWLRQTSGNDMLQRTTVNDKIVWESKLKKTDEKARKAAEKAQATGIEDVFRYV